MSQCRNCSNNYSSDDLGNVAGVSICMDCYSKIMHTCSVCHEVTNDAYAREQFDYQIMCDICFGELCSNAMNSGNGDSIIDGKAFNEIQKTNLRRK